MGYQLLVKTACWMEQLAEYRLFYWLSEGYGKRYAVSLMVIYGASLIYFVT